MALIHRLWGLFAGDVLLELRLGHGFDLARVLDVIEGAGLGYLGAELVILVLKLLIFELELLELIAFLRGGAGHGNEDC